MSEGKPIPVRLHQILIDRISEAGSKMGMTRAGVIRLCVMMYLDVLERSGYRNPGINLDEFKRQTDQRTYRYTLANGTEKKKRRQA
jgi:hypothetical protein